MRDAASWCSAKAAPAAAAPTGMDKCRPSSQACTNAGSIGIEDNTGTLNSAHMRCTAPLHGRMSTNLQNRYVMQEMQVLGGCSHSEQQGHENPAMFVTTPRTGILTLLQKVSSFITSLTATSCGVVTTTAPSIAEDK
jgi:hypothetical protein